MLPSQSSKQEENNYHGQEESQANQVVFTAAARFDTNYVDQASLYDLLLRGSSYSKFMNSPTSLQTVASPLFHEGERQRRSRNYTILATMSALDEATRIPFDYSDHLPDETPPSN